MDIDYLLLIQDFREGVLGGVLNSTGEFISWLIISPWIFMFFAVVFWALDKRYGLIFFLSFGMGKMINEVIKLTICMYRPWIRDPRILPAGDAITTATGYSTPSGHSVWAAAAYGTVTIWQWRKRKWISIIAIVLLVLTIFSRNFLGVHYPQDILIGTTFCLIVLFICTKVIDRLEKASLKWDIIILLAVFAFIAAAIIYVNVKPYPMDYVDGKLIVDPKKMLADVYVAAGTLAGVALGYFIEKNFIKFKHIKNKKIGLPIAIIAAVPLYFMQSDLCNFAITIADPLWARFVVFMITMLYIFVLVPLIIKYVGKKFNK